MLVDGSSLSSSAVAIRLSMTLDLADEGEAEEGGEECADIRPDRISITSSPEEADVEADVDFAVALDLASFSP